MKDRTSELQVLMKIEGHYPSRNPELTHTQDEASLLITF